MTTVTHEDLALASEASYKDRPEGAELDSAYQAHTVLISKGYENIGFYRDDETRIKKDTHPI